MNKEYHISLNGKNLGTFSLTALKESKIDPEVIVWFDGLDDWKPVAEVEELKAYIKSTPPPLPRKEGKKVLYTPGFLIFGLIIMVVAFYMNKENYYRQSMNSHPVLTSLVAIAGRSFAAWLVYDTMKLYKRNSTGLWAVFAFLLPSIALISSSFVKPLKERKPVTESKW